MEKKMKWEGLSEGQEAFLTVSSLLQTPSVSHIDIPRAHGQILASVRTNHGGGYGLVEFWPTH